MVSYMDKSSAFFAEPDRKTRPWSAANHGRFDQFNEEEFPGEKTSLFCCFLLLRGIGVPLCNHTSQEYWQLICGVAHSFLW
jgi:hypothetical protein